MSSNPYAAYPHGPHALPPTTNLLNSQQRTHLVRSTRKLGAVLGVTPTVLENDTPPISVHPYNGAQNLQRTDSFPSVPPGSSSNRRRIGDKPPKLYMQLDTTSISHATTPSAWAVPPTPTTPMMPSEADIRRKRMAKLTRHLGEGIPPELVSAPEPKSVAAPLIHTPRQRTQSLHTHSVPPQSNNLAAQDWVGQWNRSNIRDVQRELRNLKHQ
ncbi:hypothetical protein JVU11DRAFT_9388 [Chiua virens]|nr:hypothetical protein JVU11DRAFT_9388 [Chiua virens]